VGGIPECLRDGETALLVPRGDSSAIGDSLTRLLEDADLREALGRAARQHVLENFTMGEIARRYTDFYRALIAVTPAASSATSIAAR
jgi:colanic acid/amylovoran biosynthesis glycosyltransferase